MSAVQAGSELRAIGENFRDWGKDKKMTADETETKNQAKHTHADEKVTYFWDQLGFDFCILLLSCQIHSSAWICNSTYIV